MISQMTVQEFSEVLQKMGPRDLVLDIREPDEFADGHIPGARNLPMGMVPGHIDELKGFDHVYLICARGNRTRRLHAAIESHLSNLVCLANFGMMAWTDSGYPTERP
jgi:rhodanese-related sulfurtransferase